MESFQPEKGLPLKGGPVEERPLESPVDSSSEVVHAVSHTNPKVPWYASRRLRNVAPGLTCLTTRRYAYIWDYDPGRSKEEARFIQRLDVSVLLILSLGYFIKNLDQTNISNAYVSGMKEELEMNANQLNLIDVAWTTGYVVGQIPSQVMIAITAAQGPADTATRLS